MLQAPAIFVLFLITNILVRIGQDNPWVYVAVWIPGLFGEAPQPRIEDCRRKVLIRSCRRLLNANPVGRTK